MKTAILKLPHNLWGRAGLVSTGISILVAVYIFQGINIAGGRDEFYPIVVFVINRTTRLILNDFACLIIIFAIFREAKHLRIAFWIFLVELLVILPIYFVLKLSFEGASEISSPLLSHIHRLIVNPMLMILLIAGLVYQSFLGK